MKLEILNPEELLDIQFANWLKDKVIERINMLLDPSKLINWDMLFNNSDEFKKAGGIIKTEVILRKIIQDIQVAQIPGKLILSFSNNKFVPGFDRLSHKTFIHIITFGTVSLSGYPIVQNTLQYYADNIDQYVELYFAENDLDGN